MAHKRILIVIDMQNDFITGSLGTERAQAIVAKVVDKVQQARAAGEEIVFTRDTHPAYYLDTQEGKHLPVVHCVEGTKGWEIIDPLQPFVDRVFDKPTFGSVSLCAYLVQGGYTHIELVGVCTDICVVSNALLIKAHLPEVVVAVEEACCAGVTEQTHDAAIQTMKMCQIEIC